MHNDNMRLLSIGCFIFKVFQEQRIQEIVSRETLGWSLNLVANSKVFDSVTEV